MVTVDSEERSVHVGNVSNKEGKCTGSGSEKGEEIPSQPLTRNA